MGTAQTTFVDVLEVCACVPGYDVTGSYIIGYDVTGRCITGNDDTGNEREIISRAFPPVFTAFFPGTPLDSRYEQWNCESSLYRVTIDLLPLMLNHFPFLNCAVSRD
jgi:hypothetical protein